MFARARVRAPPIAAPPDEQEWIISARRGSKKSWRLIALAVAASVVFSIAVPGSAPAAPAPVAPAAPAAGSAADLGNQLSKTNSALGLLQSQVASVQAEIQSLDTTLEVAVEAYDKANDDYQQAQSQLATTTELLNTADQAYQQSQAVLAGRARSLYRNSDVPMLLVVLGGANFTDMVGRARLMLSVADRDAAITAEAARSRDLLEQLQAQQIALTEQQALLVAARGQARQEVEARLADRKKHLDVLAADFARLTAQASKLSGAYALQVQQSGQILLGNGPGLSLPATWTPPPGGRPEAVKVAMRYLGVPYVWGGQSPSGFDCSGLMQWTFAQIGIAIPRVSRDQYQVGMPVDRNWLLPGDLVFFSYDGTPSGVHHVAMYIGDGKMIEAPFTGSVVRIVPLRQNGYIGARRI
jgi:peptidoglycan DL-endopeptidase CwlO